MSVSSLLRKGVKSQLARLFPAPSTHLHCIASSQTSLGLQAFLTEPGATSSWSTVIWQPSAGPGVPSQRSYVQPAYAETSSDDEADAVQQNIVPRRPRRSGVLAVKAGMTHAWDEHGARIPLTVLWIDSCQVCLN